MFRLERGGAWGWYLVWWARTEGHVDIGILTFPFSQVELEADEAKKYIYTA